MTRRNYLSLLLSGMLGLITGEALLPQGLVAQQKDSRLQTKQTKERLPKQLRILCYNIHHGEGIDKKLDLDRIAKIIAKEDPDIVALQEVDFRTSRTNRVDQAKVLAKLTKLKFVFGPNIEFGGGKYGNAILSKHSILSSKNTKLPYFDAGEQRGLLKAVIQVEGVDQQIQFYCTHFDHRRKEAERVASANFVNKRLSESKAGLTFLAGDFNATIGSRPIKILEQSWVRSNGSELPTVPVTEPKRQIDFIMMPIDQKSTCVQTRVLKEAIASDHRAVLAVFNLD